MGAAVTTLPPDPDTCPHDCHTGIGDHLSWCMSCLGDVHYRNTCGEDDDATEVLDGLGVRIVPDHSQRSESDQWRLIAADLAVHASDEELAQARERHEQRVGTVPDYDPRDWRP